MTTASETTASQRAAVPAPRRPTSTDRIVVVVGTDVHPFDRLLDWTERYAAERGVQIVAQYGSSPARSTPGAVAFFDHGQLGSQLLDASVVVCHGGPGTITDARRAGHRPIVVPRDPRNGEHVDDHQQRFARRMGAAGAVELCETEEALRAALDAALADPNRLRIDADTATDPADQAARRVGEIADSLVRERRRSQKSRPAAATATQTAVQPVRVLFIGGWGRSGSTLTERLLGQLPDICTSGEITHIWERAIRDGERCGCGEPFRDCEFWSKVGVEAFGGWDRVDVEQVLALKYRVERMRFVPRLCLPTRLQRHRADLLAYGDLHLRLYQAVATVSGRPVVIDSSKHASLAFALRHARGVDLRVLHLVRDSRAVAYSWSREVLRPEVVNGQDFMPTYSTRQSAQLWLVHNALFHVLSWLRTPVLRMRYEDVVARPAAALHRIREFSGLPDDPLAFLSPAAADGSQHARLDPTHTIAGNPMRFSTGMVELRTDSAWRDKMPAPRRRMISLLTWVGRARYGYLGRRSR